MNIEKKSTLAKLLATENVSIEHRKVRTAYFDLKDRKIVLPIMKDMSSDMYDLLIGHEVSHALNTPLEGWHNASSTKGSGFKSFLNVIEDARIERDIKRRYPGLAKNFYRGYRDMHEMDFFGIADQDINKFPLIDRINLHFKLGMFANVRFTDEELVFVDKVSNCETWDDVVALAEELYGYSQDETAMEEMVNNHIGEFDEDEGEDEGDQPNSQSEESDDDSSEETDGSEGKSETTDETIEEETENKQAGEADEKESPSPFSYTDQNFRQNEEQLVDKSTGNYHYANFPKLDHKKWIIQNPYKEFDGFELKYFRQEKTEYGFHEEKEVDANVAITEIKNKFMVENRAYINLLVSQFEAKRKAAQFANARENKTGDLNMNKLWATKLTEDVFLSNTIVPDGKNHGMIMVVDFSGSMYHIIKQTIEQVLVQVSFCKKVGIPFEVLSFTGVSRLTDEHRYKMRSLIKNQKETDLRIDQDELCVMRLINSSMGSNEYKNAFEKLLIVANSFDRNYKGEVYQNRYNVPALFSLGCTPLSETIMLLRDFALDFRRKYNLDVLNTLFLTDGGTSSSPIVGDTKGYGYRSGDKVVIREGGLVTQSTKYIGNRRWDELVCATLLKHYDDTTGSRTINYFLFGGSKSDIRFKFYDINGYNTPVDFEAKYKAEWLNDGFFQMDGYMGFNTCYFLRSSDLSNVEELEVKGESKGDLIRGFRKFQKSKTTSRKFLVKFIEKIA